MSFKTAGVPFSHVASATNASVESRYACPTAILQSTSIVRTSNGSASSQAPAPTASAFSRTTCGTSIIDTDPDQLGDDIFERPRGVDLVRAVARRSGSTSLRWTRMGSRSSAFAVVVRRPALDPLKHPLGAGAQEDDRVEQRVEPPLVRDRARDEQRSVAVAGEHRVDPVFA